MKAELCEAQALQSSALQGSASRVGKRGYET